MAMMNWFKIIIIVQLFYAFAITMLTYSMPGVSLNYVSGFSDVTESINLEEVSAEVQGSLESQTNIPVVELGALVFHSGNILIDLLLNFAFAIPEMIGLLINGIMLMLNVDSYLFAIVELFAAVVVVVIYFLGLLQLLTNIRSGKLVS